MGFTVDGFNQAKSKMLGDFNKALADAEARRKVEMDGSNEEATGVTVEKKPGGAEVNPPDTTQATVIALTGQ